MLLQSDVQTVRGLLEFPYLFYFAYSIGFDLLLQILQLTYQDVQFHRLFFSVEYWILQSL